LPAPPGDANSALSSATCVLLLVLPGRGRSFALMRVAVPGTRVRPRRGSSPNAPPTACVFGYGAPPYRLVDAFCDEDFTPAFLEVCVVCAMPRTEQDKCRAAQRFRCLI